MKKREGIATINSASPPFLRHLRLPVSLSLSRSQSVFSPPHFILTYPRNVDRHVNLRDKVDTKFNRASNIERTIVSFIFFFFVSIAYFIFIFFSRLFHQTFVATVDRDFPPISRFEMTAKIMTMTTFISGPEIVRLIRRCPRVEALR